MVYIGTGVMPGVTVVTKITPGAPKYWGFHFSWSMFAIHIFFCMFPFNIMHGCALWSDLWACTFVPSGLTCEHVHLCPLVWLGSMYICALWSDSWACILVPSGLIREHVYLCPLVWFVSMYISALWSDSWACILVPSGLTREHVY